jgi:beta-glucosidase
MVRVTDRPPPALPPGFRIGAATSAYQVEGATDRDGRGPSIWDTFLSREGAVRDGSSGARASGHYERYAEDVGLLARLGVRDYRFSISWPRVVPQGRGLPNRVGLDFYDRLVDELLDAGIAPMATLYHWDLPQALEDDGGWLNRATVDAFADYAEVVADRLADRVAHWVPVNEPNIAMMLGYGNGVHAPGRRLLFDAAPAAHHMLLGHGRAAMALRAAGATSIGCANHHAPMWPATEDEADVGATKLFDALWNGMYLEPMLLGRYPVDLEPLMEGVVREGDLATIRQPLDFYGVNYFMPMRVGAAPEESEVFFQLYDLVGYPETDYGWPVVPSALREWLITFRARYRAALPPLVVTECGAAYDGGPDAHGVVDDQDRIDFLHAHLEAVAAACRRGVDVRGLYVWSLLDTLEWTEGFGQRFGLVHVDPDTLERTPKASYHWLAGLIAAQTRSVG